MKNLYKDEGVSINTFEAIYNTSYDSIKDFAARVKAVSSFNSLDKAQSLIASNKRVANILAKNAQEEADVYDIELAKATGNEYELALAYSIEEITPDLAKYINNRDYNYALELLSSLDKVVSEFFDNVMVMDEDIKVRQNRITLLANLHKLLLMLQIYLNFSFY